MKKFLSVGVLVWMVLAVVSHALLDTSSLHEAGVVLGGVAGVLTLVLFFSFALWVMFHDKSELSNARYLKSSPKINESGKKLVYVQDPNLRVDRNIEWENR